MEKYCGAEIGLLHVVSNRARRNTRLDRGIVQGEEKVAPIAPARTDRLDAVK